MERAIQVMDYAIVIVSAVEGVEGHTETVWQLLIKYNIPTFLFINKIDREGPDQARVLDDVHANLSVDVCDFTTNLHHGEMEDAFIEFIAERDETLFEKYLDTGYDKDVWLESCKRLIKENKLFPSSYGSALKDEGIANFLDQLGLLTDTNYDKQGPFSGRVYKIRYDENGNRLTRIIVLSGTLSVRA